MHRFSNSHFRGRIRTFVIIVIGTLGLGMSLAYENKGQPLLVENGKARAQIVIAKDSPRTVKLAAAELQTYIKKITSAELPIGTEATPDWQFQIYVGKSSYTEQLGVTDKELKGGAFRMVSGKNWMVLMGADRDFVPKEPYAHSGSPEEQKRVLEQWDAITGEHFGNPYMSMRRKVSDAMDGLWDYDLDHAGSFNAVSQFLGALGVRWYMPGPIGEVIPSRASIELPKVNKTITPDFSLRRFLIYRAEFFTNEKDQILWQMRMGLNQGEISGTDSIGHGMVLVIARDETKKTHPEFFKLENGKRQMTQDGVGAVCLSSAGLMEANVKYLQAMFDHYGVPMLSVMPSDSFESICECEQCKGKATKERGRDGVLSDYVWDYVCRVAKELQKTHPEKIIHCLAYSTYLLPPEQIDNLPPNVMVGIAGNGDENDSEVYRKLVNDWRKKITSGYPIYQWDYYLNNWEERFPAKCGVPDAFPIQIVNNLRFMKGKSMGVYVEVRPNIIEYWNIYVTARFLWDADQDLNMVMNEYYRLFYGPAEKQMRKFFEFSEIHWKTLLRNPADIDRIFALIDKARLAAGNTVYGKRIDMIIEFMEPLKRTRELLLMKKASERILKAPIRKQIDITLDGRVDETFWKDIPAYPLMDNASKQKPAAETFVKYGWSGDCLHIGIRCEEPEMHKLKVGTAQDGDASMWKSDSVEIFIETMQRSYYQITANPEGAFINIDWNKNSMDMLWKSGAKVAAYRGDDFWSVEVRIPVTNNCLEGGIGVIGERPTAKSPWYVNIGRLRTVSGKEEASSLSAAPFNQTIDYIKLVITE